MIVFKCINAMKLEGGERRGQFYRTHLDVHHKFQHGPGVPLLINHLIQPEDAESVVDALALTTRGHQRVGGTVHITNPNMEWFKLEIATFKFAE
jgi:hypothetical protein